MNTAPQADAAADAMVTPDPIREARSRRYSLRDLLNIAMYHRGIAIFCLTIGIVTGTVAFIATPTQYIASSLLIILVGRESAAPQDVAGIGPGSINIDGLKVLQSEISIIESDEVLADALTSVGVAKVYPKVARGRLLGLLPPRPPEEQLARAVEMLHADMSAADSQNASNNSLFNGSNILRVSLKLPDRQMAIATLNAISDSYLKHRKQIFGNPGGGFLRSELDSLASNIAQVEANITQVRTRYRVLDIVQDITLASARQDNLLTKEREARERQQAVRAEIAAVQDQLAKLPARVSDSRDLTNHPTNDDTRNTLLRLELERAHLAKQYAPTWPALRELDAKITAIQASISAEASRPNNFTEREIRNPAVDVLNNRLVSLVVEDSSVASQLVELDQQLQEAQGRVAELREADARLHDLERERGLLETQQHQIAMREASVRVQDSVTNARNTNVEIVQPATANFTGTSMGWSYLAAATVAGLALGIAAAVVAAQLRRVFVVPREVEYSTNLPDLADIEAPKNAQQDMAKLALLLVDQAIAAPRLPGRGVVVLQVMGTEMQSTRAVAVAMAVGLASQSNMRTLLLDPEEPSNAAMSARYNIRNLTTHSTTALLDCRGPELTPDLVEGYDVLVVISPSSGPGIAPGLGSDHELRRIAGFADVTLLVVAAEKSRNDEVLALRDGVLAIGGRVIGFVFVGQRNYIPEFVQRWV